MGDVVEEKNGGRCSGHCCHSFAIDLSPGQLLDEAKRDRGDPQKQEEAAQLAGMLIYHGQFRTNPLLKTTGESWAQKALLIGMREVDTKAADDKVAMSVEAKSQSYGRYDVRGQHWYGCRHIQLNGDCGIYETRPQMCRKYPNYGDSCKFEGCTMSEEAQKAHFEEYWPNSSKTVSLEDELRASVKLVEAKNLTKKVRAKKKR